MIGFLIGRLFGGIWKYVAMAGAAVVLIGGFALKVAQAARDRLLVKQAGEVAKRSEKGRVGASEAAEALRKGKTPEDVVSKGDKKWKS